VKRLLLDQGLPRSSGVLLTGAGWDVIHVGDIGMSRAGDDEILRRAHAESRVCVRSTRISMPCSRSVENVALR
jgi:predicted nuclease of predicted toxin-antitoxin system